MSNFWAAFCGITLFLIVVGIGQGWFKGLGGKIKDAVSGLKDKLDKE